MQFLLLLSVLSLQHSHSAPVTREQHRMPASVLQALSSRGTLILEAALKTALQVLEEAVKEQNRQKQNCGGCTPCLFQECANQTIQCREMDMAAVSEPTCEVILAAQSVPDPVERSWALSKACSFYQSSCQKENQTSDICVQAMAGHCHLKLQECKLESDMDYLNISPEEGDRDTCGQTLLSTSNNTGIKGRIVGGSITPPGSWPWLVNIRLNGDLMCGGVLLGDFWVLTAAHCFTGDINELHWTVVVGQYDLRKQDDGAKIFHVNRIVSHPKFNQKTFNNDLALLELTTPVTDLQKARPVCLPEVSENPTPATNCYIAGWGSLYEDGPLSDVVMEAQVPVLSQEECKGTLGKDMLTSTMFCAGYLTGGIDSCQGDSGGPLTCQDPVSKLYALYGITSWGDGCGERGKPGVYTKVTAFTEWIRIQMKKSSPTREPTCFELTEQQEKDEKSEVGNLCYFYRQSCPGPLSQEACTRFAEEKCRQKQRRCELRSYLKSLLDLLRRAEDFLRHNINFSFFTHTIPQFMEDMYSNIFPTRIRRDVAEQIPETEKMDNETLLTTLTEPDKQTENETQSTSELQNTTFESVFKNIGPGLEDWISLLHGMTGHEALGSQKAKSVIEELFLQGKDNEVMELESEGWKDIQTLKSQLRREGIITIYSEKSAAGPNRNPAHSQLQKREIKSDTRVGKGCQRLEEAIREVQSINERYKWILQVQEKDLSMDFQEILVDLGSKNSKGLYKARVRVLVAGKSTTFIGLVGMENSSFYRSMPGIIALSLDALKT
ncbi:serine protease 56 [Spea bombifrons]|uniref:serine protease 56 n=1 Tax=Spea bombifrons TaxID=233779 RepID=UPI002349A696|nr:serine protease 56 [Spea bombifrons]